MLSRQRSRLLPIVCIAILSLASCAKSSTGPTNIPDQLSISYENGTEVRNGDVLAVWIENQSSDCVSFPLDYGLKLFVRSGQTWTQIPNLAKYSGAGPIVLNPKGEILSQNTVVLRPDVSGLNLTAPTEFYASITGHLCDDESFMVEKQIPFTVTP